MPLPPLKPPMTTSRVMGGLKGSLFWFTLCVALLVANLAQVMSLLVFPFSPAAFRRFNRWAADQWWGGCVRGARALHGFEIILTGDTLPSQEDAIVVSNHQQMPDITVIMDLAHQKERLGDLKFVVKNIIKYVPGVGWGMLFLDCVFVKRRWTQDHATIAKTFRNLVANQIPCWLVSFVEGTRFSPDKLVRSNRHAVELGQPPTRHVLRPRTKGFAAAVQGLRGHVKAVYDLTIGYVDGVPTLGQYITGAVRRVHLHVRRFAIDTLPDESTALGAWLLTRFQEKDELLEGYYATGGFPELPPPSQTPA